MSAVLSTRLARLEKIEATRLDRAHDDYLVTLTNEELDRLESILERKQAGNPISPEEKSLLHQHNLGLTKAYQKIVICDISRV